eukprot:4070337-Pyramimonas_sp.AAC.1
MTGPFAEVWLLVCPTCDGLQLSNEELQCGFRLRLGKTVTLDGPDSHGHSRLATALGGGVHARHTELVNAWRQTFVEAGS